MHWTKITFFIVFIALQFSKSADAQMTVLRKNILHQNERTQAYSKRSRLFTSIYQVGNLLRTGDNDSLNTAKGMSSWIYGLGTGVVLPIAGPVWLNFDATYQFRNYRMRSNNESILARVDRLQKHRLALHTIALTGYLRLSTSKNKPLQGKYIEFGYSYGFNFSNRLIIVQGVDPTTSLGASQVKSKYRNTAMFANTAQHVCMRIGREGLSIFADYRLSDFFRRSKYVYQNQKLPELSKVSLGITLIINKNPSTMNTDESETTED